MVVLNSSLLKFLLFHNGNAGVGDCCSLENDNETPIFNNSGKTLLFADLYIFYCCCFFFAHNYQQKKVSSV